MDAVRAAGAIHVIDRATDDVVEAVRKYTSGRGAAAVLDPIGASTYETSLRMLAPLLRQAFIWNHNAAMGSGFEGLVAKLAAQSRSAQPLRKG